MPVGYALRQSDEPPTFTITRAWKVGQRRWRIGFADYWKQDSIQYTWDAVKARAAALRATEGWEGKAEAIPFFCIVDGNTVHEVKASPLNGRGKWVAEWECVVMVDG